MSDQQKDNTVFLCSIICIPNKNPRLTFYGEYKSPREAQMDIKRIEGTLEHKAIPIILGNTGEYYEIPVNGHIEAKDNYTYDDRVKELMMSYLEHTLNEKEKVTDEFLNKARSRMHSEPVMIGNLGNDQFQQYIDQMLQQSGMKEDYVKLLQRRKQEHEEKNKELNEEAINQAKKNLKKLREEEEQMRNKLNEIKEETDEQIANLKKEIWDEEEKIIKEQEQEYDSDEEGIPKEIRQMTLRYTMQIKKLQEQNQQLMQELSEQKIKNKTLETRGGTKDQQIEELDVQLQRLQSQSSTFIEKYYQVRQDMQKLNEFREIFDDKQIKQIKSQIQECMEELEQQKQIQYLQQQHDDLQIQQQSLDDQYNQYKFSQDSTFKEKKWIINNQQSISQQLSDINNQIQQNRREYQELREKQTQNDTYKKLFGHYQSIFSNLNDQVQSFSKEDMFLRLNELSNFINRFL